MYIYGSSSQWQANVMWIITLWNKSFLAKSFWLVIKINSLRRLEEERPVWPLYTWGYLLGGLFQKSEYP